MDSSQPLPGFVGHHDEASLPIKAGDRITIPAGVNVGSFNPSQRRRVTARKQTVTVVDILCGMDTRCNHVASWDRASRHPGCEDLFAAYDLAMEAYRAEEDADRARALYDFACSLRVPISNPELRWGGTGGYWCWVDINDVLGTSKTVPATLDRLAAILNS